MILEYIEMEKAEKKAEEILERNNYKHLKIKCCATCKKSSKEYSEEARTCDEAYQEGWVFGEVDDLGICDLFECRCFDGTTETK